MEHKSFEHEVAEKLNLIINKLELQAFRGSPNKHYDELVSGWNLMYRKLDKIGIDVEALLKEQIVK